VGSLRRHIEKFIEHSTGYGEPKASIKEDESMPYEKLTDLPDSVSDNLPKRAQEIYRAAYNSAEEQYDEENRRHRVAWSAVKEKYEKDENGGEWVEKED
jgi:cation transport regulator